MDNTTNYNLNKPEYDDTADIKDINDNMDTIDSTMKDNSDRVGTLEGHFSSAILKLANGGTGASTAAGARSNLGLAVANNVSTETIGSVLDARQGKWLNDKMDGLGIQRFTLNDGDYREVNAGSQGIIIFHTAYGLNCDSFSTTGEFTHNFGTNTAHGGLTYTRTTNGTRIANNVGWGVTFVVLRL